MDEDTSKGLTVLGSDSNGLCQPNYVTVTFGEDLVSGCILSLDFNDLQNCDTLRTQVLQLLQGSVTVTHVGMYGDAYYQNISDWVEIVAQVPSQVHIEFLGTMLTLLKTDFISSSGCLMPTSVYYTILVANIGSISNAQSKIVGVLVQYEITDWLALLDTCIGMQCQMYKQNFEVNTIVNFAWVQQQATNKVFPNPPFPRVPSDVFYPFYINSGSKLPPVLSILSLSCILWCLILYSS